jgi:hypothetical protein
MRHVLTRWRDVARRHHLPTHGRLLGKPWLGITHPGMLGALHSIEDLQVAIIRFKASRNAFFDAT